MVMIEQGVIATAAFDALNRTIDSIAKLQYFSNCKSSPCREIAKEQEQTNYNFIYLCGGDLRLLNHVVFSAHRVFRHAGMDVRCWSYSCRGHEPVILAILDSLHKASKPY